MAELRKLVNIEYSADGTPFCLLDEETISFLGKEVVLAIVVGREIRIVPKKLWDEGLLRIQALCEEHPAVGSYSRFLIANSITSNLSGGTMELAPLFLEFAGIAEKAVLTVEDGMVCLVAAI